MSLCHHRSTEVGLSLAITQAVSPAPTPPEPACRTAGPSFRVAMVTTQAWDRMEVGLRATTILCPNLAAGVPGFKVQWIIVEAARDTLPGPLPWRRVSWRPCRRAARTPRMSCIGPQRALRVVASIGRWRGIEFVMRCHLLGTRRRRLLLGSLLVLPWCVDRHKPARTHSRRDGTRIGPIVHVWIRAAAAEIIGVSVRRRCRIIISEIPALLAMADTISLPVQPPNSCGLLCPISAHICVLVVLLPSLQASAHFLLYPTFPLRRSFLAIPFIGDYTAPTQSGRLCRTAQRSAIGSLATQHGRLVIVPVASPEDEPAILVNEEEPDGSENHGGPQDGEEGEVGAVVDMRGIDC